MYAPPADSMEQAGVVLQYCCGYTYLQHFNALGSTLMTTDQTGAVQRQQIYGPWGQGWEYYGSWYTVRYAGMDFPGLQGNDVASFRDYNQTLGRWLVPDPGGRKVVHLNNPQTWNMYTYVTDNPTSSNDPSGEACFFGVTIFGSYFGGRCADDTPPPSPAAPGPPQGAVGTATFNLITAQNQARANPAFQPTRHPRKTYCNMATCSIASQMHGNTTPLENSHGITYLANQQGENLLHSGQYHVVSPGEAQALGNQGVRVYGFQPHIPHGHIATVRPNNTYFAPYENTNPGGTGPMINNIGGSVGIMHASKAFYSSSPVIFIAPNNPNQ